MASTINETGSVLGMLLRWASYIRDIHDWLVMADHGSLYTCIIILMALGLQTKVATLNLSS